MTRSRNSESRGKYPLELGGVTSVSALQQPPLGPLVPPGCRRHRRRHRSDTLIVPSRPPHRHRSLVSRFLQRDGQAPGFAAAKDEWSPAVGAVQISRRVESDLLRPPGHERQSGRRRPGGPDSAAAAPPVATINTVTTSREARIKAKASHNGFAHLHALTNVVQSTMRVTRRTALATSWSRARGAPPGLKSEQRTSKQRKSDGLDLLVAIQTCDLPVRG